MNDPVRRRVVHWFKQKEAWRLAFAVCIVGYGLYGYFFSWSFFSRSPSVLACSSVNPGPCRTLAASLIAERGINKEGLGYLKISCVDGDDSSSCIQVAEFAAYKQISAEDIAELSPMIYSRCLGGKVHLCPFIPKLSSDPTHLRESLAAIDAGCRGNPELCIYKSDYYLNAKDQKNFLKQEKLVCEDYPQYCDNFLGNVYRHSKRETAMKILSKYCSSKHHTAPEACRLTKNLEFRK